MNKIFQLIFWLVFSVGFAQSTAYKTLTDLPYYENPVNDAYQIERCKLDLYYPELSKFPNGYGSMGVDSKAAQKRFPSS